MKLRHKIGELIREAGLSYSQFGRRAGIGMRTAKELYDNPYYLLETPTLMKCAQFFDIKPGELVIDEEQEQVEGAIAPLGSNKSSADSELIDKLLALVFPESLLSQARQRAGKDLVAFIGEAMAEKLEREDENSNLLHKSSGVIRW